MILSCYTDVMTILTVVSIAHSFFRSLCVSLLVLLCVFSYSTAVLCLFSYDSGPGQCAKIGKHTTMPHRINTTPQYHIVAIPTITAIPRAHTQINVSSYE